MLPITSILFILTGKQIVRMLLIFVKLVQFQVESREKLGNVLETILTKL